MKKSKLIDRFTTWRIRRIGDRNFIYLLSIAVGLVAGFAAVVIKNSVHLIRILVEFGITSVYENYLFIIYPAIGIMLTILFLRYVVKGKAGHGIPEVLWAISRNNSILPKSSMFSNIVGSALTVGFGGSVGLEGPSVSTGAALGSNIGRYLRLNQKQITLMIGCASAGAIASIFKAPIAGIVFSLEVLMLDLTMSSIVPLLIASVSATLASYLFLGQSVIYQFEPDSGFRMEDLFPFMLLGVLCGLISMYFTKIYMYIGKTFKKLKNPFARFAVGSAALGLLVFLFPPLFGEGYNEINNCLKGDFNFVFLNSPFYGFHDSIIAAMILLLVIILLKVVAMSSTFAAGGVGGIFAPSLFVGANLGLLFSTVSNYLGFNKLSTSDFALVGMAGIMAGVMHAPLTSIFLIAEITGGYHLLVPLMITSTLAYVTIKYFVPYSINALRLAERGELITHNKDKSVLSMMKINDLIEQNFNTVNSEATLGELVKVISVSQRNIFPVVDDENNYLGLVFVNDIRNIVFNHELYNTVYVRDLMFMPEPIVDPDESMEEVAHKFEQCSHYNLPVLKDGKYIGFISRANVFSKYRSLIKSFSEE
jgi:chloride channel protein, CIC family